MTGFWKILAVLIALCFFSQATQAQGPAFREAALRIRTRVYNPAKVSIPVLSRALNEASAIYQRVGIEIEWIHCPCDDALDSSELYVQIIPKLFATLNSPFKGSELGYAATAEEGGMRAMVFYDRIEKLTVGEDTSFALGRVIAHELGHLLLGTKLTENGPHAANGIMRAPWNKQDLKRKDREVMQFTLDNGLRLRARVLARFGTRLDLVDRQTNSTRARLVGQLGSALKY